MRFISNPLRYAPVLALAALCTGASAQDFPSKQVRIVVPYATGGQPDVHGRILSQALAAELGQAVIVENIPGAGGVSAVSAVMSAPADGHTIFLGDAAFWAINPALKPRQPNDFIKNFAPVRMVHVTAVALVVNPSMQVNTLQEFLTLVKSKPGVYSYASAGVGSIGHLTMEAFKTAHGVDILHVPYKSSGQALPAIISGEVNMIFSGLPAVASFIKAGRLKVLAVSTKTRTRLAPDVPSVAEISAPDFNLVSGGGLLVRTGTPRAIIDRIAAAVDRAYTRPEVISRLNNAQIEFIPTATPDAMAEQMRGDIQRWSAAVKASGASTD
jgi:tripartite-type tricarboxylate transporter receptor subunit TctC